MRERPGSRVQHAWREFLQTPTEARLSLAESRSGAEEGLVLFHACAVQVPAYRDFLRQHGVNPESVRTLRDLGVVPATTKENYIRPNPLPALCPGGTLSGTDFVAVSSGSTGEPTFWPRSLADEFGTTARFEQVLHDSFEADRRPTLAVVCFALGSWVGGMYTASCLRHLAAKGWPLLVVTPGSSRDEILRVVLALGGGFEQTILLGYPPFLKDVVDTGIARGMDWRRLRIRLVLAGEVFSEEWRALMGERTGADDVIRFAASLYGTADGGVLACETPLSITIRRWLARNPDAARELFGESRLPTLAQFDPGHRLIEAEDGRLLITGDGGVPLVRYNILDSGGVHAFDSLVGFLRIRGFDPLAQAGPRGFRRLPFVHVFGRSHFAVSFYGANVYPENVMVGLEQPEIRDWTTGRFVLRVVEDSDRNAVLSLVVERAQGVEEGDPAVLAHSVRLHLERLNSEFAHYVPPERRTPRVEFRPPGDPEFFPPGVKHRYTR